MLKNLNSLKALNSVTHSTKEEYVQKISCLYLDSSNKQFFKYPIIYFLQGVDEYREYKRKCF